MHSIRHIRALLGAMTSTFGPALSRHAALTRVGVVGILLAVVAASSLQQPIQAGPIRPTPSPSSILPENIGVGIRSTDPVSIDFDVPMDRASVEAGLAVRPGAAWHAVWASDSRSVALQPAGRWQTDARYVVSVSGGARTAAGGELGRPQTVSFTTQTAPVVTAFRLQFPGDIHPIRQRASEEADISSLEAVTQPSTPDTVGEVSTQTLITIGFSTAMDREDVERHFVISPAMDGALEWSGNSLVFAPAEQLTPEARYAVTVAGAHDDQGNPLGGDASFSFTTRAGAQVVRLSPADGASDVTDEPIAIWFSQPMASKPTGAAVKVTDLTTGNAVTGTAAWNADGTQLRFAPSAALARGHEFEVTVGKGASDVDHNAFTTTWTFSTEAPPPPPAAPRRAAVPPPPPPGPPAPADLAQFALWQVNQSRAQYGFAPLVLEGAISAVASAHAWDQIQYGYFSHTGRDGSRVSDRLRRGGVSFSSSGENLCYVNGSTARAMLEWCHSVFMSEPYPGVANHIGNILSPRFSRMGIGIAQSGTKIIIVWNFAG